MSAFMGDPTKGPHHNKTPVKSVRLKYHLCPARFQVAVAEYDAPSSVKMLWNGGAVGLMVKGT